MNPLITRSQWTAEEDWIIFLSKQIFADRWNIITQSFISRSEKECLNRWNKKLKQKHNFMQDLIDKFCKEAEVYRMKDFSSHTSNHQKSEYLLKPSILHTPVTQLDRGDKANMQELLLHMIKTHALTTELCKF